MKKAKKIMANMTIHEKIKVLKYVSGYNEDPASLSEEEAIVAAEILVQQLIEPYYLPPELNPDNWLQSS